MKRVIVIPVAIVAFVALAFLSTNAYRVPTLQQALSAVRPPTVKTVHLTVNGLKCVGTSRLFAEQIADVPGVVSLTTYARTHTAIVEYDPALTNPETIRAAAVEPIVRDGQVYNVFEVVGERDAD
jgi:hypothetical protein